MADVTLFAAALGFHTRQLRFLALPSIVTGREIVLRLRSLLAWRASMKFRPPWNSRLGAAPRASLAPVLFHDSSVLMN